MVRHGLEASIAVARQRPRDGAPAKAARTVPYDPMPALVHGSHASMRVADTQGDAGRRRRATRVGGIARGAGSLLVARASPCRRGGSSGGSRSSISPKACRWASSSTTSPVYLRVHGVSLAAIGVFSSLTLPWTLKPLWAPLVDRFGERRQWIAAALVIDGARDAPSFLSTIPPHRERSWSAAVLAAHLRGRDAGHRDRRLHDRACSTPGEEGIGNGVRVSAYRAALIASGGGLVAARRTRRAGRSRSDGRGGDVRRVSRCSRGVRRRVPSSAQPAAAWVTRVRHVAFASRRGRGAHVHRALQARRREHGADGEAVLVGQRAQRRRRRAGLDDRRRRPHGRGRARRRPASPRGSGSFAASGLLGLLQALSNLGYAGAASVGGGRPAIYAASMLESFTGGLGTAAFLAFLMHVCEREQAATQYALLSALFGLTRSLSGAVHRTRREPISAMPGYFAATLLLGASGLRAAAVDPPVDPRSDAAPQHHRRHSGLTRDVP